MYRFSVDKNHRLVANWLFFMAFAVFLMVIVGGATRLTESGLSMVNWNPVTGALPPLDETAWQKEFSDYKTSPEYKIKNHGMSLEDFKGIFYWEWVHRLLGRLLGVFFFLPLVWFWARGQIPRGYKLKLVALLVLGGSQGLLGWYMVQSGLVNEPAVSHYRLTAHLMLALFIFAALFWTALSLRRPEPASGSRQFRILTAFALVLATLQLTMGALVAGLKAGHIFNTWPLMDGSFVPEGLMSFDPWWRNLLDNAVTVQFDHRLGAYALTLVVALLVWRSLAESFELRRAAVLVAAAIVLQMVLGIVMLVQNVPVSWGTAHQAGGVIFLAALINIMHMQRRGDAK